MGALNGSHIVGAMITVMAHRGRVEQARGESKGIRDTPWDAGYPVQNAAWSAMTDQVMRCMRHCRHRHTGEEGLYFWMTLKIPAERLASLRAARHRRPPDPPLGVVGTVIRCRERHDGP